MMFKIWWNFISPMKPALLGTLCVIIFPNLLLVVLLLLIIPCLLIIPFLLQKSNTVGHEKQDSVLYTLFVKPDNVLSA